MKFPLPATTKRRQRRPTAQKRKLGRCTATAKMGGRHSSMTSIAPEPPAPPSMHGRADGLSQARTTPRMQAREVTRARRPQHARQREDSTAQEEVSRYEDAAHRTVSIEVDSQSASAGRQAIVAEDARHVQLRQLAILSEVSVVGQEFGWAQDCSRAKRRGSHGLKEPAAGVFGVEHAAPGATFERRTGRDTATELRRFMQSADGSATSDEDIDKCVAANDCPRSPAQLEGHAGGRERKTRQIRPASAPLGTHLARRSLEVELRREIAASKARTDHMCMATKAAH